MAKQVQTGVFNLIDGRKVFGSLLIAGKSSHAGLFDDQQFPPVPGGYEYLTGLLHDGQCVTLIDCVLQGVSRKGVARDDLKCSASLFPNTVVTGPCCVPRHDPCVSEVKVFLNDAHSVFYDFDAFSGVLDPEPFIPLLKKDKERIRPLEVGPRPIIGYFSGKFEIVSVDCPLGRISARHRVSETMAGPRGLRLNSQLEVSLRFQEPLAFKNALERKHALIRFFELIIGREQLLLSVELRLEGQREWEPSLKVAEAYAPEIDESSEHDAEAPAPRDVLLCTVDGVEDFRRVAVAYFEKDDERLDARSRFAGNIRMGRLYTIDRIVSAANMFDIFPDSAYPDRVDISEQLESARRVARENFRVLPQSIERDSILGALGRMGELSLKRKVLHRLQVSGLQLHFQGIDAVLKEAVNCRNHYVHGSKGQIDYTQNLDVVVFLCKALEFLFGVSDLVDCGWSFDRWVEGHPQESHPFGEFRLGYQEHFHMFEELFNRG